MKKLTAIIVLGAIMLVAFTTEKFYTVKFSEAELVKHVNKLQAVKQIVNESNLPHQQVVFVVNSIDSLTNEILLQVQPQLKDTTKKK